MSFGGVRIMRAVSSHADLISTEGARLRKYCAKPKQFSVAEIQALLLDLPGDGVREQVVGASNVNNKSAVHFCCQLGADVSVLKLLISHGADVNAATNRGHTPLIFAAGRGRNEHVNLLLDHRANPKVVTVKGDTALSMGRDKLEPKTLNRLREIYHGSDHVELDFRESDAAVLAQIEHAKHCRYCRPISNGLPESEENAVAELVEKMSAGAIPDHEEFGKLLIKFAADVTKKEVTHGFVCRVLKETFVRVLTTPQCFTSGMFLELLQKFAFPKQTAALRVVSDEAMLIAQLEQIPHILGQDKRPVHVILEAMCEALGSVQAINLTPISEIIQHSGCPILSLLAVCNRKSSLGLDAEDTVLVLNVYNQAVSEWISGEEREIVRVLLRQKVSRKRGGIAEAKSRKLLHFGLRIKELLQESAGQTAQHCVGCARNGRDPSGHRLTARLESQRHVERKEHVRKKKCPFFYEEEEWGALRKEEELHDRAMERAFWEHDQRSLSVEASMLQVVAYAKEQQVQHHLTSLVEEKAYMVSSKFQEHWESVLVVEAMPKEVVTCDDTSLALPMLIGASKLRWLDTPQKIRALAQSLAVTTMNKKPIGIDTEWTDTDEVSIVQMSDGKTTWIVDCLPGINGTQDYLEALRELLQTVFTEEELLPLGFSFCHDSDKLKSICAEIITSSMQASVLDLQKSVMQKVEQNDLLSLKASCELFLGRTLDKTEQISDWEKRPLTPSQLRYAALDAEALVMLFEKLHAGTH